MHIITGHIDKKILVDILQIQSQIPELIDCYLAKQYEERLSHRHALCSVAYENEDPFAFMLTYPRENDRITRVEESDVATSRYYLWHMATIPRHRGKGSLSNILRAHEDTAVEWGYTQLWLMTRHSYIAMGEWCIHQGLNKTIHKDGYVHYEKRLLRQEEEVSLATSSP